MSSQNRLGELLVREKLISLQQLRQAQEEQRKTGSNLGYALAKLGYISDGEITNFLSTEVCEKHKIVPLSRAGSLLVVAMADPTNLHAIDDIKFLTGFNVDPVVASETAIVQAIERAYSQGPSYDEVLSEFADEEVDFAVDTDDVNLLELEKAAEGAPVVR